MRPFLFGCLLILACKTTDSARQGGADFKIPTTETLESKFEDVAGVCFQTDTQGKVILDFADPTTAFEVQDGASNSIGRCVREVGLSFVFPQKPTGKIEVRAPKQPMNGWAVADWVKLLAAGRYSSERGILNPGPQLTGCLQEMAIDATVIQSSGIFVESNPPSESARCVAAVLSSVAWPSQKNLVMTFSPKEKAVPLTRYFRPAGDALNPLAAESVSAVIKSASPQVGACWNETLIRRTGIGGAKTFRFSVDAKGKVSAAWVAESSFGIHDALLDACLERVLFLLQFEPTAGEGVYTWNFATRT
jgi:hypothetical protein